MNPGVLSDALDNHGRVTPLDHEEGQRLTTERPKTERVLDILGPLGRPIGGVAATSPVNATESSQCRGLMPENESAQPCRIRKGVDRAGERCPPALWRRHERRVQCVSPSQRACVPTPPGQRTRSASRGRSPADARAPTADGRRRTPEPRQRALADRTAQPVGGQIGLHHRGSARHPQHHANTRPRTSPSVTRQGPYVIKTNVVQQRVGWSRLTQVWGEQPRPAGARSSVVADPRSGARMSVASCLEQPVPDALVESLDARCG